MHHLLLVLFYPCFAWWWNYGVFNIPFDKPKIVNLLQPQLISAVQGWYTIPYDNYSHECNETCTVECMCVSNHVLPVCFPDLKLDFWRVQKKLTKGWSWELILLGCMAGCKSIWAWALSWGLFLALETHAIHHQLKIQYLCGHILQDIESTIESRGRQSQLFQRLILWKLEVQHQRDKKRRHMRVLQSLSHI